MEAGARIPEAVPPKDARRVARALSGPEPEPDDTDDSLTRQRSKPHPEHIKVARTASSGDFVTCLDRP